MEGPSPHYLVLQVFIKAREVSGKLSENFLKKEVVFRADRVRRGSDSMRRSTRLSRSSTMSSDLPVVDENSAFVANSKDFSDRSSSASTRKSLRKSSLSVVVKPIEEDLMSKIESVEAEFNDKKQLLAGDGAGWTEKKEGDDSGRTPERSDDRESGVWNDVATPATVTPNRRSSVWKDVATPTPAQADVGESSTSDEGAPNTEVEEPQIDLIAKQEADKLDLNAEELLTEEEEEEEAEQEVDENRVSSLTEPEYEVTEGDGEADDIDGLSFESSMIGLEEGPKEEKEKEEVVNDEDVEVPASPIEAASEELVMPPPAPVDTTVTKKLSPISKPVHMATDDVDDQYQASSGTSASAIGAEAGKVPKRSSLNLSSMMTAKINKGLKHSGVDVTLATSVPFASADHTVAVEPVPAKESKAAPAVRPVKTKALPVAKPAAAPDVAARRAAPVVALRDRKAPIEAAAAAGINIKKKTVVPARAFGTVGVGAKKTTISSKASVVTAATATSQAAMRRPFAGSKEAVSTAFDTSLKPRQGQGRASATSVSLSREAVKAAKEKAEEERAVKVTALKAKWAQVKESKLQKNAAERQQDLERLNKLNTAAAAARKHALERRRVKDEDKKRQEVEELAVKVEDRLHVKKVTEEDEKRRRRESVALRTTVRERAEISAAAMEEEEDERERSLLESRRQDAQLVRAYKEKEREDRRVSLAVRGAVAQRQKQETALWEQQRQDEEIDLIERRRAGWEDTNVYKDELKANRRESVAGRLDVWRKHKVEAENDRLGRLDKEVERLELRREDWKTREAAKVEEKHAQREETVERLDQWRKEKTMEAAWEAEEAEREALERELQAAELDDVRHYQAKLQDDRRQSLAFRLDKSRIDAEHERSQFQLQREIATEEARLKEQDREDVRTGNQAVIDSRRLSLEYRTQRAIQHKRQEEGDAEYQRQMKTQDRELSEEAWRDVKRYQEQCREECRKELASSLLQQRRDYAFDLQQHQEGLERLHEDMELRRNDWKAVKASKKADCARRRRSISMRLDSWRSERLKEAKRKVAELARADEEARTREEDREALQRHKKNMQLSQLQDEFTHGFVL